MKCAYCKYNDGAVYTSIPPKYRCTITNEFHLALDDCNVEFAPVKHGRWIWNKRLGEWYCSNCDRIMTPYTVEKSEGVYEMAQPFYCGWCGAKMNEVENGI